MIWREKERSRIRSMQIDSLKGPLGIRRMDRRSNAQIRDMSEVTKEVMKGLTKLFSDVSAILKKMGNNKIAKRICG